MRALGRTDKIVLITCLENLNVSGASLMHTFWLFWRFRLADLPAISGRAVPCVCQPNLGGGQTCNN